MKVMSLAYFVRLVPNLLCSSALLPAVHAGRDLFDAPSIYKASQGNFLVVSSDAFISLVPPPFYVCHSPNYVGKSICLNSSIIIQAWSPSIIIPECPNSNQTSVIDGLMVFE